MFFDVDERLQWALRLKAAAGNLASVSELIREIVSEACRAELAEVDRRIANGEAPRLRKSKRKPPKPRARP